MHFQAKQGPNPSQLQRLPLCTTLHPPPKIPGGSAPAFTLLLSFAASLVPEHNAYVQSSLAACTEQCSTRLLLLPPLCHGRCAALPMGKLRHELLPLRRHRNPPATPRALSLGGCMPGGLLQLSAQCGAGSCPGFPVLASTSAPLEVAPLEGRDEGSPSIPPRPWGAGCTRPVKVGSEAGSGASSGAGI